MTAALRVDGLSVSIGSASLLSDVHLQVAHGEWVSVIGPNGAGKSTLLKAIGRGRGDSGTVHIDGVPATDMNRRDLARSIAWVPQTPEIPDGMRALDYVLLGRTPHLHLLGTERRRDLEIAHRALEELDLAHLADRFVHSLSGGELQRAAIARALAQEASVLLLDEPTSALDLGHQQDVLAVLDTLRSDGTRAIVSTMHDLTLAGQHGDRMLLLANGRVAATGRPAEVLTEHNVRTHYRADVDLFERDGRIVVVPRQTRRPETETP